MFNKKDFLISLQQKRLFLLLQDYRSKENSPSYKIKKSALTNKEKETILHNGKNNPLYKLKITLTVLSSKILRADFWCKSENYMLFKFIIKKRWSGYRTDNYNICKRIHPRIVQHILLFTLLIFYSFDYYRKMFILSLNTVIEEK